MEEILKMMLNTPPIVLALVAIVLLVFVLLTPYGKRALRALKVSVAAQAASNPNMTGSGLVLMLEDAKAPVPRHWATYVDERIDHKMRNLVQSVNSHMEMTEEKLAPITGMDEKLDDLRVIVARIEGMMDRRHKTR